LGEGREEGSVPRARNRSSDRIAMAFTSSTETGRKVTDSQYLISRKTRARRVWCLGRCGIEACEGTDFGMRLKLLGAEN